MLLALPMCLGVHHDLVLTVDHRHGRIALDHALAAEHLRALVVRDVALLHSAAFAYLVFVSLKKPPDFCDRLFQRRLLLRSGLLQCRVLAARVFSPMTLRQVADRPLHLLDLLAVLLLTAAPLLARVAR